MSAISDNLMIPLLLLDLPSPARDLEAPLKERTTQQEISLKTDAKARKSIYRLDAEDSPPQRKLRESPRYGTPPHRVFQKKIELCFEDLQTLTPENLREQPTFFEEATCCCGAMTAATGSGILISSIVTGAYSGLFISGLVTTPIGLGTVLGSRAATYSYIQPFREKRAQELYQEIMEKLVGPQVKHPVSGELLLRVFPFLTATQIRKMSLAQLTHVYHGSRDIFKRLLWQNNTKFSYSQCAFWKDVFNGTRPAPPFTIDV